MEDYARQRAGLIDPEKANCTTASGSPARSDTTYLAAIDRDGNIVSLIQSNYDAFGSGVAVKGRGFVLQDRGGLFVLDPSHPNALAPRKRPFHTIIPAFMEQGDTHIGFGIMGGANQPLAHALGWLGSSTKQFATILLHKSAPFYRHARAKSVIVTLYE